MAYEKQTFVDFETTLKAEHLQHIEDGIVEVEGALATLDNTVYALDGSVKTLEASVESLESNAGTLGESIETLRNDKVSRDELSSAMETAIDSALSEAKESGYFAVEETDPTVPDWAKTSEGAFEVTGNPVQIEMPEHAPINVVTVLEPQQEGSGDPYPAGGGRNLLNNTATTQTVNGVTFTVNADGTVTVNGTATDGNAVFRIQCKLSVGETYTVSGCPAGGSQQTYFIQLGYFGNDTGSGVTATATEQTGTSVVLIVMKGTTVSNLVFKPMIRLASDTDSTYAPYSNIRPFIGYDKLGLNHAGKNLLPNASAGTKTVNGITLTSNGDGSYNLKGAASSGASIYFVLENSVTIPGGAYWHLLNEGITGGAAFTPKFSDGTTGSIAFSIANRVGAVAENLTGKTITEFGVYVQGGTTLDITFKPMLCLSDAPSDFAPYQGKLHTVQIGQTVYGGRMDWLTGKLVAEYAFQELDGTETFVGYASGSVRLPMFTPKQAPDTSGIVYSNMLKGVLTYDELIGVPNTVSARQNGIVLHFDGMQGEDSAIFADIAAKLSTLKAAGTPVQIAYKLATPIEIDLSAQAAGVIEALNGVNTLYGDGTLTVSGKTDVFSLIDYLVKRIEALESQS